ncbi:universal stress protein [Bosea sp. 2KB_26]|uniref:universal stress protein n=1 Tax=Bosea sp. 2KB_26 TaxID=3237475 RepID=UPI000DE353C3
MYQHILVPTDGSPLSAAAVEQATQLAKSLGARLTLLAVTEPFHIFASEPGMVIATLEDYQELTEARAQQYLTAAQEKAAAADIHCDAIQVESEHPYQAIIDTAVARGCDLIAMASHGRRGIAAIVLGSETVKVLTHSKIPVLVYR